MKFPSTVGREVPDGLVAITIFLLRLGFLAVLTGCSGNRVVLSPSQSPPALPYRTWEIGLIAPNYMEVWVEGVDVMDQRGLAYVRVHGGVSSIQNPAGNRGKPSGWPARPGPGKTRPMTGIDLPEILFVRWQSLAEPQTYRVRIDVPQDIRDEMVTPYPAFCRFDGHHIEDYRNIVTIGLAPGGIAKAWLSGACLEPVEIGRFTGSVHPKGPSEGLTEGRYALPLAPEAQEYVDEHGIPFGTW